MATTPPRLEPDYAVLWGQQFAEWADRLNLTYEQGLKAAEQIGMELEYAADDRAAYAPRETEE